MIRRLFREFPKYAIVLVIVVVSMVMFVLWMVGRGLGGSGDGRGGGSREVVHKEPLPEVAGEEFEFDYGSMFVSGGSLYQLVGADEVKLIRDGWLPTGDGGHIVYLKEEDLIVFTDWRYFTSFDTAGNEIGTLRLPGGARFEGFIADGLGTATFSTGGDIWRGKVDWKQPAIVEAEQVTSVGYFRSQNFMAELRAGSSTALLYQHPGHRTLWIDMRGGTVKQASIPVRFGVSPRGDIVVGDKAGNPHEFIVIDVDSGEFTRYSIGQRIQNAGILWLSDTLCAVSTGNQLHVYNHESKEFGVVYEVGYFADHIILSHQPSPDGERFLFGDSRQGMKVMEIEGFEHRPVAIPAGVTAVEWVGVREILLVMNVADSELRGTWLKDIDGKRADVRILDQPLYERLDPKNPMPKLTFQTAAPCSRRARRATCWTPRPGRSSPSS